MRISRTATRAGLVQPLSAVIKKRYMPSTKLWCNNTQIVQAFQWWLGAYQWQKSMNTALESGRSFCMVSSRI